MRRVAGVRAYVTGRRCCLVGWGRAFRGESVKVLWGAFVLSLDLRDALLGRLEYDRNTDFVVDSLINYFRRPG